MTVLDLPALSNHALTVLHKGMLEGEPVAKATLWMNGTRLVYKIVDKMIGVGIITEDQRGDATQSGLLSVGESLPKWDPKRGRYSTFIWTAARNAILDYAVGEKQHGLTGEVDIKTFVQEQLDPSEEAYEDVEEVADLIESDRGLELAMDSLESLERSVVFEYYYLDKTDAEIGRRHLMSTKKARALRHKAVDRMRLELAHDLIQFGFDY